MELRLDQLRRLLRGNHADVAGQMRRCGTILGACLAAVLLLTILALASGSGAVRTIFGLIDFLALLAIALLAYATYQLVTTEVLQPLDDLRDRSRRFQAGDLHAIDDPVGGLEFQQITGAMSSLGNSILAERSRRAADRTAGEREASMLRQILKVSQSLGSSLDPTDVLRNLATGAKMLGEYTIANVWTVDDIHGTLVRAFSLPESQANVPPIPIAESALGRAASTSQTVRLRSEDGELPGLAMPIVMGVGLSTIGVLELRGGEIASVGTDPIDALETLASHAATAINASRLHQEVELRSETDALTRVFNRRKLDVDLKGEVVRSLRFGHPLALIMVDVDHFKNVNDSYGHKQGDEVLKLVAAALAKGGRETDSIYRFGGEEFAVLLRETQIEGAQEVAEKLRLRLIEETTISGLSKPVTASFGVATICENVQSADKLVEAADAAMYNAKKSGRNQVVVSTECVGSVTNE